MDEPTQRCRTCKTIKSLDEFGNNRHMKNGKHRSCKECCHAAAKPYRVQKSLKQKTRYEANRARILAQQAGYYVANKDVLRPVRQAWEAAHREERNARLRVENRANPEAMRARRRLNYAKNRAKLLAKTANYYRTHPEKEAAKGAKRRARKVEAPINDLTAAQWLEIQAAYDHRCVYCGKRAKGHLTQDHITPLSKGGSNTAPNVIPACKSCNSRKKDRPAPIAVQPLLLTVAPSKPLKRRSG